MDHSFEIPSPLTQKSSMDGGPNDDESDDDDDGGLDWTKLLPPSARPTIPKRGEKEYEPRAAGGTHLQVHILDRSRNAMFETLRTTRSISSKAVSYAVWHPTIARTEVTVSRGIHFANMGHSAPRPVVAEDGTSKLQKRLELLPEEAIYLVERGALFCWKEMDLILGRTPGLDDDDDRDDDNDNDVRGSPMSVQQAYTEMMNSEGLTLEKFQVYSYLKRLGYVVTRANPPDAYYPTPAKMETTDAHVPWVKYLTSRLVSWMTTTSQGVWTLFRRWMPFRSLYHYKSYSSVFQSLRFIPAGHGVPLKTSSSTSTIGGSPYRVFYNVYKPSTPFRKSAPPQPDFQLVVVNARTTQMPTLWELTNLFEVVPEIKPQPRRRIAAPNSPGPEMQTTTTTQGATSVPPSALAGSLERLFRWIFRWRAVDASNSAKPSNGNPFAALKMGKKIVIVAAVDMGSISFFRFGQGEFGEWPMA